MRIGVDVGGTKVEAAVIDVIGRIIRRVRVPSPAGDYEALVAKVTELVTAFETELAMRLPVGIGIPGAICPTSRLVKNANSTWLNGRPLDRDLAVALKRTVRLANDADCFALSEATDGAGEGAGIVFGVILGTGVGGGIVVDGRLLAGPNAIAGEWGHNPLPWPRDDETPGQPCYCGKLGCIETWLSGPGFRADHLRTSGHDRTPLEIAAAAGDGEPEALASYDRYVDRLSRGLATVVNVIDPHIIVLGGGVSNIEQLAHDVSHRIERYVFSPTSRVPVRRNVHGDSSGVRGAAWLWPVGSVVA